MRKAYRVLGAGSPDLGAFSVSQALFVLALIDVSLGPLESAFAVQLVLLPISFVAGTSGPLLDAKSFFLVVLEHPGVDISVFCCVCAATMFVAAGPLALE